MSPATLKSRIPEFERQRQIHQGKNLSFSHPSHRPLLPGQDVSTTGEILAFAASNYPEKTGFICGLRSWTFQEMDKAANRFANFILANFADLDGPI